MTDIYSVTRMSGIEDAVMIARKRRQLEVRSRNLLPEV